MGLDQIKVELLSSWQGGHGGDGTVAHAAWASSVDAEKLDGKTDEDIRRIVTNVVNYHHDTPKERLWMEFFLTVPIFVERQFDKYRMTVQYQDFQMEFLERPMGGDHLTQNELSGRYRTLPERYLELPKDVAEICERATGNNQWTTWADEWHEFMRKQHEEYLARLVILKDAERTGKITNAEYKRAREVWRGLCGTATMTDMRMVMNLNAFEHIINQRLAPAAQPESRAAAYLMLQQVLINNVAPIAINKMFEVNGWTKWFWEMDKMIVDEIPFVNPNDRDPIEELTPEDRLWLAILRQDAKYKNMDYEDIEDELEELGFPDRIVRHFLNNTGYEPHG